MGEDVNKLNEVIFKTTDGKEFHMNANEFCEIEFHGEPHHEDYFGGFLILIMKFL